MKEFTTKLIMAIITIIIAISMWIAVFAYGTSLGFYASTSAQVVTITWLTIGAIISTLVATAFFTILTWEI